MLIVRFGQRKWNWPRSIGPRGSKSPFQASRARGRTASRRTGSARARTRPPRRPRPSRSRGGRPGSGSTRGSSRNRPSSSPRTRSSSARGSGARRGRAPDAATSPGSSPSVSASGARLGVRVDEDERAPRVDEHRTEAEALLVEARLPVRARGRAQGAVEVVRPRVVGALERLAPALALADERAAVTADVHERAQLAFLVPHDDDRGRRQRRR